MYKKLIDLRRKHDIIVWGDYELVEKTPEHVFAYSRIYEDQQWLVICNMSSEKQTFTIPREAFKGYCVKLSSETVTRRQS